jgi:hypothetical protein
MYFSIFVLAVPDLSGKLENLTCVYINNKEQVDAQTAQIHQLLKQYNDIVSFSIANCIIK